MNFSAYLEAGYRVSLLVVARLRRAPKPATSKAPPDSPAAMQPACIHVAEQGDTLWRVAERHGVSPYALLAANPQWSALSALQPGQRLHLPRRSHVNFAAAVVG